MRRLVLVLSALLLGTVMLAGCGDGSSTSDAPSATDGSSPRLVDPATALSLAAGGAVVIDVRTPEEFAAGHLQGARNVDVSAPTFDEQIARMPMGATYVVYCRSGSRSAAAAARMTELGFTDVADAGAFEPLADAGGAVATG